MIQTPSSITLISGPCNGVLVEFLAVDMIVLQDGYVVALYKRMGDIALYEDCFDTRAKDNAQPDY
jgi:hypothetical protein